MVKKWSTRWIFFENLKLWSIIWSYNFHGRRQIMTLVGVYLTKAWSAVVVLTFALVNHLDHRQSVGQSLALALPRDSEDKKKRH